MQNKFSKQLVFEKQMKRMESFVWFSYLFSHMVFKLSKIVPFFTSEKPKTVIAIYVYASERLKLMNFC